MKLKHYSEYKDSGAEWIGKIPKHWETHRFKVNFKYVKGKIPENLQEEPDENSFPYLSMEFLRGNKSNVVYSNSDPKAVEVNDGDLLLLWDGSNAGEFVKGKKGYLSSTMVKLIIENIELTYSNYLCRAFEVLLRDLTIGMGIPHVNGDSLGNILITYPNFKEQKAIASFLDKKTSEIDLIIEKDTRLIELLKEKRTALINQAVTKGLDPDAPMKDSGMEWIGEIPDEWEVNRLKFLVSKIGSGVTPKGGANVYVEEGIPLLRSQNIHFGGLRLDDVVYITEEINKGMLGSVVRNHDVLLNITGASIGRTTYIENLDKTNVNQHVCIIRPEIVNYKFLSYYLSSRIGQDQIFSSQMGTSREGLNFEQISNFIILCPPKDEQKKISSYLDKKTSNIDLTIEKIHKNISLLEEYKKSLIHHVVTGKVDVREVAV